MSKRVAGKLGRNPDKELTMGTFGSYVKSTLPKAPKSFDYAPRVANGFPMALNDRYGDCTVAGVLHLLQLFYAEVGEVFPYPGDAAVRDTYFHLTGGVDSGLVLSDVLKAWSTEGLFGTKIIGAAPINFAKSGEYASATYCFGGVYLGVELPQDAEQQFEDGDHWHKTSHDGPIIGGHCIVGTGVNPLGGDAISWGEEVSFTREWFATYRTNGYVVIPEIFVEANHGPVLSLDLNALQKDFALL